MASLYLFLVLFVCLFCFTSAYPAGTHEFILESSTRKHYDPAVDCDPSTCKLPTCRCATDGTPGNVTNPPQFVLFTMDDGVDQSNYDEYCELMDNMKNPDGSQQRATFFVCGEGTSYELTGQLADKGHEIADHTLTHRTPTTWWKEATYDELVYEIMTMRANLHNKSHVKTVSGFRAPYLQTAGDTTYAVLADHEFVWDSSLPTASNQMWWPYTLDHLTPDSDPIYCHIRPCPQDAYPGLWEVPLVCWIDDAGYDCNMIDACVRSETKTPVGICNMMLRNFKRHYLHQKSPFPMFGHSAYFDNPAFKYRWEGLKLFLKRIRSLPDVYFVSISQLIEWVKHPSDVSRMDSVRGQEIIENLTCE